MRDNALVINHNNYNTTFVKNYGEWELEEDTALKLNYELQDSIQELYEKSYKIIECSINGSMSYIVIPNNDDDCDNNEINVKLFIDNY